MVFPVSIFQMEKLRLALELLLALGSWLSH